MRRSERLNGLKGLCSFPSVPGFMPNQRYIGEPNAEKIPASQRPLVEWAAKICSMMANDRYRDRFCQLLGQYQDANTANDSREEIAEKMVKVIRQEIHDLEDEEVHWTITPTFWLVIVGILIGIADLIISMVALNRTAPSGAIESPAKQVPSTPARTPEPATPTPSQTPSIAEPLTLTPKTTSPEDVPKAPSSQEHKTKPKIITSEP